MDDAAAAMPWDALLALVARLGDAARVDMVWDDGDDGSEASGATEIPIPGPGDRPACRLRLIGGHPLPAPLTAAVQTLAQQLWWQEQRHALQRLLGRHVVHDLRTPVTIIQGYGDLLRSGRLNLAAGMAPLQAIVDQTARLLAILTDFALASGTQVPGRHLTPGSDLARSLQGRPHVRLAPGLPCVAVDSTLLADIVQRLLRLAEVSDGPPEALAVAARATGDAVWLTVADSTPWPLRPVAQAILAGLPPKGNAARLPWLMRLLALQRLVVSQGGCLALEAAGDGTVWQCRLPAVPTAG